MSEYEFRILISALNEEAAAHAMNYFTVWSAYLLVGYFVGRNLNAIYTFCLTIIYTFFVFVPGLSSYEASKSITAITLQYSSEFIDEPLSEGLNVSLLFVFVYVVAWIMSIIFMYHRRKTAAIKSPEIKV
jgi:hypothetical protein